MSDLPAATLVPFPLRGLNENWGFHDPIPGTTRDVKNMRPYDHTTGRLRGGQRMGMTKYVSAQINGDASDAQAIAHIVKSQSRVSYTEGTPTKKWSQQLDADAKMVATVDEDGNLYVATGVTDSLLNTQSIAKINESSVIQWTKQIAEGDNSIAWITVRRVELETFIFVCMTVLESGINQEQPGYIVKYKETAHGLEEVWRLGMVRQLVNHEFD